ncbi:RNA polymerase factor sigma-54 [Paenibacillus gansuensis]|uniref:RNA polymerase factor sigma-54 n=1 Tax=Paenibacillus gansuensis TaxID=306542 RepID=A0ABW5PG18_9BACL
MLAEMRLTQEQAMKTILTAELRQSVAILQMPGYELLQHLQEESRDNPLIELEYPSERLFSMGASKRAGSRHGEGGYDPLLRAKASEETLEAQLIGQLKWLQLRSDVFEAAVFLAGNINDQGYLDISLETASRESRFSLALLEEALTRLQALEPVGVGARTLQECLLLQVRRDDHAHPLAEIIIARYLESAAFGRCTQVAQELRVSPTAVGEAMQYIRTLDPKPGCSCCPNDTHYIVPDAYIEKLDGTYTIRMNEKYLPKVTLSSFYHGLKWNLVCKETAAFLKEKEKSAEWLLRSLDQRKKTLVRVIETIVEEQMAFLERGDSWLRPMSLKVIAEKLGMHESTISRAVSGKYVKLPGGMYELKYFFSAGLATFSGEAASSRGIKARIKAMVDKEDRKKPLSDQRMAELLLEEGIHIARRTVAKYREELRILPSSVRKEV